MLVHRVLLPCVLHHGSAASLQCCTIPMLHHRSTGVARPAPPSWQGTGLSCMRGCPGADHVWAHIHDAGVLQWQLVCTRLHSPLMGNATTAPVAAGAAPPCKHKLQTLWCFPKCRQREGGGSSSSQ